MGYRGDIDGLRGIAILLVVAFHAGSVVPGGFIGVDVFFVISGFLITQIIAKEIAAGTFSILNFYERRARRILPALIVVLVVCTLIAAWTMLPSEFEEFGKTLRYTAAFAANHRFAKFGYFDQPAESQPLLHLWSLSVEEQFYLFFPLIMILALRKGMGGRTIVVLLLTSFAASVLMIASEPKDVFFLLPFRAWELLFGSVLALGLMPRLGPPALVAGTGVVLIVASAFSYSDQTPFPGLAALLPVFGSVLVIQGGREANAVSKALSWKPLVFVGLISYSLYLWHWPLLVYGRTLSGRHLEGYEIAALVALAVILSMASWHFVERPFRTKALLRTQARALSVSVAALAFFLFGGIAITKSGGLPERWSAEVQNLAAGAHDKNPFRYQCAGRTEDPCVIGKSGETPSFAVVGDSHASAVWTAIAAEAEAAGRSGVVLTKNGCGPMLVARSTTTPLAQSSSECPDFWDGAVRYVSVHADLKTVVIIGRWPIYASLDASGKRSPAVFQQGLESLVAAFPGRRIFLSLPTPEYATPVPDALVRAHLSGKPFPTTPEADFLSRSKTTTGIITAIAERHGAGLLNLSAPLCEGGICITIKDGKSLYHDADHLSVTGAQLVQGVFRQLFTGPDGRLSQSR
jgi:peptidoglycan/LPS O-acetylase OafA/YrhL